MTQDTKATTFAPKFQLGQIVATQGAIAACSPQHLTRCLHRHSRGDWGLVCPEDKAQNDQALVEGERVLSAYAIDESKPSKGYGDNCLWIITELNSANASPGRRPFQYNVQLFSSQLLSSDRPQAGRRCDSALVDLLAA
jgi:hypothetical protein